MQDQTCSTCGKPKAALCCELCECVICKKCAQILDEGDFSFLIKRPPELDKTTFCQQCFSEKIATHLETYQEMMERAKTVNVYMHSQGKETRLFKRTAKPIFVNKCPDEAEALLRLAFQAAQQNYDCLVDVRLTPEKIRNGSYQTTLWDATGVPTKRDRK